ncbi:MAG: hypothetical protein KYX66_02140 [Blastomonas fulva]|uniref:hypothetical protein n=1 Tax=Blastomonas fulva TaxID=1550728 RepID=UPI0024E1A0D2|nr:hypothetical protein [Blastomonas fulva]MDK2755516.1 hypothetical protein [Blastomonas fulva]
MTAEDRQARTRFFVIGAVRLVGAITIALAVAITYGRISGVPREFGYGLLLFGILEMLIVPQILVKRWKSPSSE